MKAVRIAPLMIAALTVSTVSALTASAFAESAALTGIQVLLALLILKELLTAASTARFRSLIAFLDIAILPLMLLFVLGLVARLLTLLD